MSYNGIGLQTPRGSGTNGHIQRNMSSMRQREPYSVSQRREEAAQGQHQASRRADLGIVQHEAKRLVESQVMQYRIQLESQEEVPAAQRKTEEDLDRLVDLKRKELLSQSAARKPSAQEAGSRGWQTHGDAVRKEAELEKMRSVLRLRADYVEGTAMANQDERRKQRMERGQATEQGETRHPNKITEKVSFAFTFKVKQQTKAQTLETAFTFQQSLEIATTIAGTNTTQAFRYKLYKAVYQFRSKGSSKPQTAFALLL
ncbi:hypothetical protein BCR37DRAFT_395349 [Protomyces lactucae-debilis]|uniref:CWF21 domain-containing protein n=1 Tax=Protomyces lactucae-debilis TaxID=2754530 RepID=A0A1Y2EWU9_PROLT|nr:uncharacterized protein BCR37DRAFT_395349 [Protomyces lactucae-debilis]ORY76038.1 hypothetical protein BCR37DRAFT_395349 [Protomyces lactucae-debilis]